MTIIIYTKHHQYAYTNVERIQDSGGKVSMWRGRECLCQIADKKFQIAVVTSGRGREENMTDERREDPDQERLQAHQ